MGCFRWSVAGVHCAFYNLLSRRRPHDNGAIQGPVAYRGSVHGVRPRSPGKHPTPRRGGGSRGGGPVSYRGPPQPSRPRRGPGPRLRAPGLRDDASVHLPTTLDLASPDPARREASLALARRACACAAPLEPAHYVLHVPALPPTLVAVPGQYLHPGAPFDWAGWRRRALRSLALLAEGVGRHRLLVENINYSPCFLDPLLDQGFGLCLDVGHLLLGDEDVPAHLERYLPRAGEIHLHGVQGHTDHLSLARLPPERVKRWAAHLRAHRYRQPVTLEVFRPEDLTESAALLRVYEGLLWGDVHELMT